MKKKAQFLTLPSLPLRDVVVFPNMVIPLFVGRVESINAIEAAMEIGKQIYLVAQKDAAVDVPKEKDLYKTGAVTKILQLLRLPDGTVKVLVEGIHRARLLRFFNHDNHFWSELQEAFDEGESNAELELMCHSVLTQFEQLVKLNKRIPPELLTALKNMDSSSRLADSIAAHMTLKIDSRQKILEETHILRRFQLLSELLTNELELFEVEKRVQGRLKKQVEKSQRQYYLTEKIKALQEELGELDYAGGAPVDEIAQLEQKIKKVIMPKEAREKAKSELSKLKMMPPMSAEATVCRNYLEVLLQVPWKTVSKVSTNLKRAEQVLEADHYGLKEVKERILEYLAVQRRVKKLKGPILCLVGPPGVGKTSLGQSIANATGRKFARISLGGVRDEAEIRGHRRTYIGAMPGKIIQRMVKKKVRNPLFMLDEVDKIAMDFRGDPASALLEVLDPEQNNTFNDHYLEVDYDLSDVMFIATANSLDIPGPLLDRMEVIRLAGYTEDEKLNIAKRYLTPRQKLQTGFKENEIKITDGAIREIIRNYTREAGVRNLERDISKICRKVIREILSQKKPNLHQITRRNLEKYLGVKKFRFGLAEDREQVGQVIGLAWTEVGGELLTIEAQVMPGKGKLLHTGSLGDVMQESIHAAMTVVRSRSESLGILDKCFQENDFHIHVPEGATPKDGPSAGVGMCTAMISAIIKIPVKADVAMTGEITLRGEVLPIGGLKEKLLAALRGGVKTVVIPQENKRDLNEIPKELRKELIIKPVRWIDQVLEVSLTSLPQSLAQQPEEIVVNPKKKCIKEGHVSTH